MRQTRRLVARSRHVLLPALIAAPGLLHAAVARADGVVDLLPNVSVDADRLADAYIDATTPGVVRLRLTAATPNTGNGALEIRGSSVVSPTTQEVVQRIYRSDGSFHERVAGTFTYHPEHQHIHFDDWAIYRLREVLPDGSPGAVLAEGEKTSFCLEDLAVYDVQRAVYPAYTECGSTVQGISPGWADVYDRNLPDQWIDITGLPLARYWIEAEVDPDNLLVESDEYDNVARVLIDLSPPPAAQSDPFEDNDSPAIVAARPEGALDSPNLGVISARREIAGLSLEDGFDYFEFRLDSAPEPGGFVRIDSKYLGSDLDLALFDAAGHDVGVSRSGGNLEQVSLEGLPSGTYVIGVSAYDGQNPSYRLTIDPHGNHPPLIALTDPHATQWIESAFASIPVRWTATDPEGDPIRVALFIDRDQTLDKGTRPLGGYQNLLGAAGQAQINSVGLELGRWFVRVAATDGSGENGAWAPGSVVLYVKGDLDGDGRADLADWRALERFAASWILHPHEPLPSALPEGWRFILDLDRDGDLDAGDLLLFWNAVHAPSPSDHPPGSFPGVPSQ